MRLSRRKLFRAFGTTAITAAAVRGVDAESPLPGLLLDESLTVSPILLDRNENPYGPSERVLAVLRDYIPLSNRYPGVEREQLTESISRLHRIKDEQIVVGCGSTEILKCAAALFLGRGQKLFAPLPSFSPIRDFALTNGGEIVEVPLNKRYQHNLDATLARVGDSGGIVYICNPNNATGTLTPRTFIEEFLRKLPATMMVVIDEAFHHYVIPNGEYVSFIDKPLDDPRIIVVRTFSHVYGLAGMRVGYGVAAPKIARRLQEQTVPLGVTSASMKAAATALEDSNYAELSTRRNADARQEFLNRVNGFMLRALDSHTNFVTVNPMRPPEQIVAHLKANEILIGPLISAMPNYIRVSLGTPADMNRFWAAWAMLPATGKMAM
jgi:histidinol-phosphate aminotransferase